MKSKDERLKIDRQRNKRFRIRRNAAGLCVDCKAPTEPNRKRCETHLALHRMWQKQWTARSC